VTVTGTPTLALDTTPARSATYASGSGTSTLTFDYTVQAGDNAGLLDYAATTSLTLNGGTIRDAATNDATLTLPTPGAAGSLSANKSITIDTTAPTVSNVTASNADGSYGASTTIHVQVVFAEPVVVTGSPTLALDTGRDATYASGSGGTTLTFDYTVQAGDTSADLDYTATTALALNGGTIKDAATNVADLTLASPGTAGSLGANKNIVIDTTAPTVTNVTATNTDGAYKAGQVVDVQVAFDEPVTVTGTPTLALNTGEDSSYVSGSGTSTLTFDYTVQPGDTSADLDYTSTTALALSGGTIQDAAANDADLTLPSPGGAGSLGFNKAIVIDTTAPTVTSVSSTSADGYYVAGQTIHVTVGFSEPVTVTGTPTLALNTTPAEDATYASGSGTSTLTFDYVVQPGDDAPLLDYAATTSLALNGGTIQDAATNDATLTLPTPGAPGSLGANKSIVIDTTAPMVAGVSATNANGAYTTGATIHVTVAFTEPVTVTGTPKLALDTSPARSATYAGGSGTSTLTFDYTVQAGDTSADLDYTATTSLTLNGGTIRDVASNDATLTLASPGAAGSLSASKSITIDTTAPAVTNVTATNANGSYNAGATIHVQVAFTEPVTVTGAPTLALNTSPAEDATYASGSGTSTLTFDYAVQPGDTASLLDYAATSSLALNGGTIQDAATNDATLTLAAPGAAGSLSANKTISIDTTVPTASSRSVNGAALDITYSEALDPSFPAAPSDFTVKVNGSTVAVDAVAFTSGNTVVELTLHTPAQYLDVVTVAYSGTALRDPAGNQAATYSAQAVTNLTPDAPPATPALVSPADGVFTSVTTPTLSATFSDPDTLDTGKVTFEVCSTSNCSASLGTFDSTSTALAVGQAGSAAVPGGFGLTTGTQYWWRAKNVDASTNASAYSATRTFTVDTTAPAVSASASTSGPYEYWDGGAKILWLNATEAGSFALTGDATDAQSGIAKVNFPALFGTGSNDQTTPTSGSTYTSSTYSFDGTGTPITDQGSQTVTAYNGDTVPSGALTSTDALSVDADGVGPAAFSLGGPADGAKVRTGVVLSAAPSDSGSGVASVAFFECDATAHPGCDPTDTGLFGSQVGATQTTPTLGVYSVSWTNTGATDGHDYALAAVATDNVANATTSSINTVTVDNSAPLLSVSTPVALTGAGAQHYDAGTTTLFLRAAGQGSFTLEASASDPDTGIGTVTFPSVFGTGSNAGTNTGGTNYESSTYSFDGTSTPISSPGAQTINATNGVTLPSPGSTNATITITADGAPPATNVQFPVENANYDTSSWNGGGGTCTGTPAGGNVCGTVSDAASGVASVSLTIEDTTFGLNRYFDGSGFTSATPVPLAATLAGSNWNYPIDASALTDGHHYVTAIHATDNVGNAEVDQIVHFTFGADVTPPVTDLSLTGASHAFMTTVTPSSAYDLFYSTASGGGAFKIHASSTDQTGTASIDFPDLTGTAGFTGSGGTQTNSSANPWNVDSPQYTFDSSATTEPGLADVTSTDAVVPTPNTGDDTITFVLDNAAPTGGALTVDGNVATAGGVSAWQTSTSVTVDTRTDYSTDGPTGSGLASSLLTVEAAPLAAGSCGSYGTPTTITGTDLSPITFTSGNCYRFTLTGADNVDNEASLSVTLMIDTTPPSTPSVAFSGLSAGNTYDDGLGTLFFRPSAGGTYTVNANGSTDPESGVASYTFSQGGTQPGNQLAETFDGLSSGSNTYTVHSTDTAGLDSGDATYTVTADSTAPSGGALTVNGTAAAASPTSSYFTSGSTVTIDSRTDYTDAGSGIASSTLTVESAPFAANTCGAYGAPTTISGTTPQTVSNGNCYLFTLTGTDNVGNTASLSTVVMVDTTPPTQPTVVFSNLSSGNTFLTGSTLFFRPAPGGTFTITATGSSDPESGIVAGNGGYTFSPLNASGGSNFGVTQTVDRIDVTFDGTTTGPTGGQSVVVNDNAGLGSTPGTYTVTQDSTAPSGGSVSVAPTSTSTTIAVTEADYADSGSGMASNVVTRSDPLAPSGGVCPGSGYAGSTVVPLSGHSANDTVPADGQCYEYTLTGTDNVGNVSTTSTTVLVDSTPPSGGSIAYPDGVTNLGALPVDWASGSDPQSGIAQILVQRADATLTGTTCGSFSGFATIASNPGSSPITDSGVAAGNCYEYQLVVTNGTGLQTTYSSGSVAKLTNSSPIALAPGASSGTYLTGTTLYLGGGSGSFQLELTADGQTGVTQATWQGKPSGSLTSAPPVDTIASVAPFLSGTYSWTGGGIADTIQLTRDPTASVDTLSVVSDTTPPNGSISYTNGVASAPLSITTSASDPGGSGLDTAQVQRAETTLVGATCNGGGWTGFTNITLSGGADTTVASGHCYQYQLVVTDKVGNSATYGSASVAQIPDTTPPTFVSGSTNAAGTVLSFDMSEPLDCTATTPAGAFGVTFNGVAQPAPTGISCSGSTITLNLATPPDNSQTVKLTYTQPGSSGDRVRDLAVPTENEAASFGPVAITNGTTDTVAPTLGTATVDGATLTLTFDEALAGAAPGGGAFTVNVDGSPDAVTGVAISGNVVTLTLTQAVTSSNTVAVSYAVPALNALHDAAANTVAAFASAVTNNTPAPPPPPSPGGGGGALGPVLVSASPDDGSTIAQVASLSLLANESVTWSGFSVTRPDGSVTPLPDRAGQSETWAFATTTPGLYVIQGTISAGGQSQSVLSHFTIWTSPPGPAGNQPPPVQKNAFPGAPDDVTTSDGNVVVAWPAGAFNTQSVIQVVPRALGGLLGLPPLAIVVDVSAFSLPGRQPIHNVGDVVDIQFPNAARNAKVLTSEDGKSWQSVPQLATFQLPAGQTDGWFRDSDGTVHILTRHLSLFAVTGRSAATRLAIRIAIAWRLWIRHRPFVAIRFTTSAPARVTGSFVGPGGIVVPGQTVKTPTRHAGVTILRVPMRVTVPGVYRLQMHADGIGQAVDATTKVRFLRSRPRTTATGRPHPLRVVVIRGAGAAPASLARELGGGYVVRTTSDAKLYDAVATGTSTEASAVVVGLDSVPIKTLASLHALMPELQIVAVTNSPGLASQARSIGVTTVLRRPASVATFGNTIRTLLHRR
ncbi:MAG TPA: SwmB domain-containing protein, partial [Gaiellaceae bacterium]|nr:SwmB domain-containing protein [Gaiellaceae bacterium]